MMFVVSQCFEKDCTKNATKDIFFAGIGYPLCQEHFEYVKEHFPLTLKYYPGNWIKENYDR